MSEPALAELREAFERYERALQDNDVDVLIGLFWDDPRAVRAAPNGLLVGNDEIATFRRARQVVDPRRETRRLEITLLTSDVGISALHWARDGSSGFQTQTWIRTPAGWRVAMGHVSAL